MSGDEPVRTDQRLIDAWQRTLPTVLGHSDRAEVREDAADPHALRIAIQTAGRSGYSFDFKCGYADTREVRVELVDVELDGQSVDERTDVIQTLAEDYTRHIHECAQALHKLTNR